MVQNITLHPHYETSFQTLGYGVLNSGITSIKVVEGLNSSFELECSYSADGPLFEKIVLNNIICSKPNPVDDVQAFRIYSISKPMNRIIKIKAAHISYDLSGYVTRRTADPYQNLGLAITGLLTNSVTDDCPFIINTNFTAEDPLYNEPFPIEKPSSIRSLFAGNDESLAEVYHGEWYFDNYTASFLNRRGVDRGFKIEYGKNLTDITQDENMSNVYTHVYAYYESGDVFVEYPNLISTEYESSTQKIYVYDTSSEFEETPTTAQILEKTLYLIENSDISTPTISIKVSFAQLAKTEEYKQFQLLEDLTIGDTVTVDFPKYKISLEASCVKTTYLPIQDKYESVELGDYKGTLASSITGSVTTEIDKATVNFPSNNQVSAAIDRATKLISGVLGDSNVVIRNHVTGGPENPTEILICNSTNLSSPDLKVWRWNVNGLGYSDTGIDGPYGLAMTSDGVISANFITAGVLNADILKAGIIKSVNEENTSFWNLETGEVNLTAYANKESLEELDQSVKDEILVRTQQIQQLQQQVDGQIDSWFYPYTPTLSNIPASEWTTTEEKDKHIGDTFTNIQKLDVEVKDTLVQFDDGISGTNAIVEIEANENLASGTALSVKASSDGRVNRTTSLGYKLPAGNYNCTISFDYQFSDITVGANTPKIYINYTNWVNYEDEDKHTFTFSRNIDISSDYTFILRMDYVTGDVEISNFKIELGDRETPWIPKSGDKGKNGDPLFDPTGVKTPIVYNKYLLSTGALASNDTYNYFTMSCEPDTMYVMADYPIPVTGSGLGGTASTCFYTDDDVYISGISDDNQNKRKIVTTPSNCYIMKVSISDGNISQGMNIYKYDTAQFPEYELTRCGKNLLNPDTTIPTSNGISAINENGKITVSGTATGNGDIRIKQDLILNPNVYKTSALFEENIPVGFITFGFYSNSGNGYRGGISLQTGNNKNVTINENDTNVRNYLSFSNGAIAENMIFYPQLELGTQITDYEPYNGETYTIKANEPIEIQLAEGINTFYTSEGVDLTVTYQTKQSGRSYRFVKESDIYEWVIISDNDVAEALKQASQAQKTADGKNSHFMYQPTVYGEGDLWTLTEAWNGFEEGITLTALLDSTTFNENHWVKADNYTTIDDVDAAYRPLIESNTANIELTKDEILNTVSANYTSNDELLSMEQSILTQTKDTFDIRFTAIDNDLQGLGTQIEENKAYQETYIRSTIEGIELGDVNSPIKLLLSNDQIQFLANNVAQTVIDNNFMHVDNINIRLTQQLGNFQWKPRSNGSLDLVLGVNE